MDERDPSAKYLGGAARRQRPTAQLDRSLARRKHAPEDLHQRALAGAIFAHERMHFACAHREVDAAQHGDSAESLGDPAHHEHGIRVLTRPRHFAVQPR